MYYPTAISVPCNKIRHPFSHGLCLPCHLHWSLPSKQKSHGENGFMSAHTFVDCLHQQYDSPIEGLVSHTTLFWFFPSSTLEDWQMEFIAAMEEMFLLTVVMGLNSWLVMAVLWLLDFTIIMVR